MSRSDMIFDFISPNECDKLSLMSGSDIQDLIILLNYYFIDYRNDMNNLDQNTIIYWFRIRI